MCQEKRKRPKTTGVVVWPILSHEFNSRSQVDLIDMQSSPQGKFKWIMVYQCHLTKFVILRPLSSKRAAEVAFQLLDIFLLFDAPAILQCDNGTKFTALVINELKEMWPQLTMAHGKPRHPQSQGSVERANGDIKDMLVAWMSDNNTQDWTVGLKFVQQQKNCAHHAGINLTPYKAMFGEDPKVGLTSSSLPPELLETLQSEDDLLALLQPPLQSPDSNESSSLNLNIDDSPIFPATNGQSPSPDIDPNPSVATQPPTPSFATEVPLILEPLGQRLQDITDQRKRARESQLIQAERMVKRSRIDLKVAEVGDNVAIPIPMVDKGRGDPRNILGVVLDRNEHDMYKVAVKAGILSTKYSRNQFDLCPQRLLNHSDVNTECTITLRQALKSTATGGQGFFRCDCSKGNKQCQTNRCKCFKAKILCNSKCHNSITCKNKN